MLTKAPIHTHNNTSGVPRGEGSTPSPLPPWNSDGPPKSCQTQPDRENCQKLLKFRTPTPQDIWKKGGKILKLPSVRNCFTLAMTNKLVVIIKVSNYQKLLRFYYMKWNFLCEITAASGISWLGPTTPRSLSSNWICWNPPPEQNSWVRHRKIPHIEQILKNRWNDT